MSGLVRAAARAVSTGGALVPALALGLGGAGAVLPQKPAPAPLVAPAQTPELMEIDAVLASRLPELGLSLRRRVARAIVEESRAARIDPLLVLAVIQVESEFDGSAVSWAGARGLMQLRPATAEYLAALEGVRLTLEEIYRDPALQVRLGVRYLGRLQRRFGSLDRALMAYNAGPAKLKAALQEKDLERYRGYVRAVRRQYARFRADRDPGATSALAQAESAGAPL